MTECPFMLTDWQNNEMTDSSQVVKCKRPISRRTFKLTSNQRKAREIHRDSIAFQSEWQPLRKQQERLEKYKDTIEPLCAFIVAIFGTAMMEIRKKFLKKTQNTSTVWLNATIFTQRSLSQHTTDTRHSVHCSTGHNHREADLGTQQQRDGEMTCGEHVTFQL